MTSKAKAATERLAAAFWMPIDSLKEWAKNPRLNDGQPVENVAKSIRTFGFVAPICVWESAGRMVAGHTRLKAMRAILAAEPDFVPKGAPGPGLVPVRFHEFTDEAEADAYALADNRLAEEADWHEEALADIVAGLAERTELLDAAGYDRAEIEALMPPSISPDADVDEVPEPSKGDPVTQPGDLWILGRHRLLCGDSRRSDDVERVMGGRSADMVWTDPPYNIAYVGKTRDALTIRNDEMTPDEFVTFLLSALTSASNASKPGAAWYVAAPSGDVFGEFALVLGRHNLGIWRHTISWVKDVFVLGRADYHYRHESIFYGWKPGAAHYFVDDRTQDSVWEIPRPKRSAEHPTMKPVELVARAIENSSRAGEVVLDVFGGSGTTLVAAESTGRDARLIEIDPRYCDVIVERWERLTGQKAERIAAAAAAE